MSSMSLKHTKSPSGKTHQLTHVSGHTPPRTMTWVRRYRETPQYDDQVQGDLLRLAQADGYAFGVGILPVHIDPDLLDKGQKPHSLEYLKGYHAGLEIARGQGQQRNRDAITEVREKIAALEAAPQAASPDYREARHWAWLAGYEACKRGEQMHSPYRKES